MTTKPNPPLGVNRQLSFPFHPPCDHPPPSVLRWHRWTQNGGGLHLGQFCATCGAWRRWIPQTTANLALAPEPPR
jgi:hypothetical protein